MTRSLVAILVSAALPLIAPNAAIAQARVAQAVQQANVTPYRINAGDELEIFVWGEERLQREVLVLPDGTFAFPLVGRVVAAGRLPSEIEGSILAGLRSQYRGSVPQVTVSVKRPSGYQFSVVGKVRNPGAFTPGRYVNALEALAIAGGPGEFAQTGGITIIRKYAGRLVVIPVRLSSALRGQTRISTAEIPNLESGDTLVVP